MMLRFKVALLLVTLPAWLVPALLVVGWKEAGRDLFRDLPEAFRFIIRGERA